MIISSLVLPNGATATFHKVSDIRSTYPFTHTVVDVQSYASEDSFVTGSGYMWTERAVIADLQGTGSLLENVEAWLLNNEDSFLVGGVLAVDNSDTLDAAKARAWVRIKASRSIAEVGNFTYDGGVYQADIQRINGAATLALMAKLAGQEYSVGWTLTDNSVRTLDGTQMMGLGAAVGQYVADIYTKARALRNIILSAQSIADVDAVVWPTEPEAVYTPPTPQQL